MSYQLRPYQERALASLFAWFERNPDGHPIVSAAVGAGKSLLIAEFCRRALQWPETRILMCVSSRELCRQNAEKLTTLWPEAPVGIYSAGLKSKTLGVPILYATIGSIWRQWHRLGHIDLIMIDECHNVSAKDQGMYRSLISNLKTVCPRLRVIGWTGTPFYGNGVWLHAEDDALFTDIAARVSMRELLDSGYLAPLSTPETQTRLSADGVQQRGGDYIVSQLAKALDQDHLVQSCCDELVEIGKERKRWFVYGVTVEHVQHICDALNQRGIPSAVISANTAHGERDQTLSLFKSGKIRAVCNVATMTTGIDIPDLDLIALMRNTKSPVLYTQIAGRGMRIAEGKTDCLFVDFTDTVQNLGPVDLLTGRSKRKSSNSGAPHKECGSCGAINAASARVCLVCGAEFQIEDNVPHHDYASDAPILSTPFKPVTERLVIHSCGYRIWEGKSGIDTLRVDYHDAFTIVASEWLCFSHSGYAQQKALQWWAARAPFTAIPKSTQEAYSRRDELTTPEAIHLIINKKYPEIVRYELTQHPRHDAGTDYSRAGTRAKHSQTNHHATEMRVV